jgi:hypothetical protein
MFLASAIAHPPRASANAVTDGTSRSCKQTWTIARISTELSSTGGTDIQIIGENIAKRIPNIVNATVSSS